MKKIIINLIALFILTFAFFITGCKKEEVILPIQKSEMIPIAKLTDKNEIVHLFLQKDVQAFFSKGNSIFSKGNPNEELVFVEVVDYDINDDEAGLLYRIYNSESGVIETSISMVVTFEGGIYYVPPGGGGTTVSCTTTSCTQEVNGCVPYGTLCTPCKNGGLCTRTVTSGVNSNVISAILESIN